MARPITKKGAARLGPTGSFELYLGGGQGGTRALCTSEGLKQYVKEHWDFLTSPETERQIGQTTAYKTRTSTGKMMVSFETPLGKMRLIRGDGEFATYIWELPFVGADGAGDDQETTDGGAYEGMGDPDADFSSEFSYAEGGADGGE